MPADPRARFAAALSRLQAEQGWTDYALGKAASISRTEIARLKGGQTPTLPRLVRLADVLGVTLDELCGRES